jgi:phosphatidylserine/phosphatidylglycerophosphate/cardiolipin synthase-like enzyme
MASTTDPADWFLPDVGFTTDNRVEPLIDGESYFAKLTSAISGLAGGDSLLVSGWRLTPNATLDVAGGRTAADVLTDAIGQGVDVRLILWMVPATFPEVSAGHGGENLETAERVLNAGGEAVLDARLPTLLASHHQKFVVAASSSGSSAFVGGIDLALDRLDTSDHDLDTIRQPEAFAAWHDVQAHVEGSAVADLWKVFADRWNDPQPAHLVPSVVGAAPASLVGAPPATSPAGGTAVQVLRTFPCRSVLGQQYPFAPSGDRSYEAGLVAAIDNAEAYVYLEDQYFWPCAVVDALARAVRRGVRVILVLARDYEGVPFLPYHNFLRRSAVGKLLAQGRRNEQVFVYHLQLPQPGDTPVTDWFAVHSKTVIVDDRFACIGSANTNRRSMNTDTEIGVAFVDTERVKSLLGGQPAFVGRAVREYRRALWSEHLGRSPVDPLEYGLPSGFPLDGQQIGHIVDHDLEFGPSFCNPAFIPFGLMNLETSC